MKKSMAVIVVVSLVFVLGAQLAWAASDNCILQGVDDQTRSAVEGLRDAFKERLAELRTRLHALRGTSNFESREDLKEEMQALKWEMRQEVVALLPEELKDQFMPNAPQATRRTVRQMVRHRHGQ